MRTKTLKNRFQRPWVHVLAVCAALLLIGIPILMAPIALSSAEVPEQVVQAADVDKSTPTGLDADLTPQFPLFPAGGRSQEVLEGWDTPDFPQEASDLTDELVDELGLGQLVSDIALSSDTIYQEQWELEVDEDYRVVYPWVLPTVENLVEAHLPPDADPDAVLELSSLWMLQHATWTDDGGAYSSDPKMKPLIYGLLRAQNERTPTCEGYLNLAFYVSQQMNAWDAVMHETESALELCESSLAVRWIRAQTAAPRSDERFDINGGYTGPQYVDFAAKEFSLMREENPASPLGWAGQADLWLDLADGNENVGGGSKPFQIRKWRADALEFYRTALQKSSATQLFSGYARALSANDQHDEAVTWAQEVWEQAPGWAPYQAQLANVLAASRDFVRLKDAVESFDAPRLLGAPTTDLGNLAGVAGTSFREFNTTIVFAGGSGDSQVVNRPFVPESVLTTPRFGCVKEQYNVAVVGTGGSPHEVDFVVPAIFESDAFGPWWGCPGITGMDKDTLQDFWRWAGQLDKAERLVEEWMARDPRQALPKARAGEIAFLQGNWSDAESHFTEAIDVLSAETQWGVWSYTTESGFERPDSYDTQNPEGFHQQLLLQLGAARSEQGDSSGAIEAWNEAVEVSSWTDSRTMASNAVLATSEIGRELLSRGDTDAAYSTLKNAYDSFFDEEYKVEMYEDLTDPSSIYSNDLDGALLNNLALAAGRAGDWDVALEAAGWLIRSDAANPIYLDSAAFVQRATGNADDAQELYRSVLESDSTSYVSASNFAVLRAQEGDWKEAGELLEMALAAEPEYATGWYNLGIVRSHGTGIRDFLASEGARAKAISLDPSLRGSGSTLVFDEVVYDSGVDVSKAVAADWNYASSATAPVQTFAWTLGVLIMIRVLWELALSRFTEKLNERINASGERGGAKVPWFWQRIGTVWTLLLCFNILAFRLLWNQPLGAALVVGGLTAGLVLLPVSLRALTAGSRSVRQFGWTPAVAVGSAGAVFGLPFTPYPASDVEDRGQRRDRWWLPLVVLVLVLLALVVATAVTDLPYLRAGAMSAIVLIASILLPVPPFDGSRIHQKSLQWLVTVLLVVAASVFALKWL